MITVKSSKLRNEKNVFVVEEKSVKVDVSELGVHVTSVVGIKNSTSDILEGEIAIHAASEVMLKGYAMEVDGCWIDAVPVEKEKSEIAFKKEVQKRTQQTVSFVKKVESANVFKISLYPFHPNCTQKVRIEMVLIDDSNAMSGLSKKTDHKVSPKMFIPFSVGEEKKIELSINCTGEIKGKWVTEKETVGVLKKKKFDTSAIKEINKKDRISGFEIEVATETKKQLIYYQTDKDCGDIYVATSIPLEREEKFSNFQKIKTFSVLWDCSLSRLLDSKFEADLKILKYFIEKLCDKTFVLNLVTFNHQQQSSKRFQQYAKVEEFLLKEVVYEGASCHFPLSPVLFKAECSLLFSDGIVTFDEKGIQTRDLRAQKPIYSFSSSSKCDNRYLGHVSRVSGGKFFNVSKKVDEKLITSSISRGVTCVRNLKFDKKKLKDVVCSLNKEKLFIYGKLIERNAVLNVDYELDGKNKTQELKINLDKASKVDSMIGYLWAYHRIRELKFQEGNNKDQIEKLTMKFGICLENTSLLVLSSLEQYQEYNIIPPKGLKKIRKAYLNIIQKEKEKEEARRKRKLDHVFNGFTRDRIEWYNTEYKEVKTTKGKGGNQTVNVVSNTSTQSTQSSVQFSERERFISLAKHAEQEEKYQLMYENVEKAFKVNNNPITVEERLLFNVSMRNISSVFRNDFREQLDILEAVSDPDDERRIEALKKKVKIKDEFGAVLDKAVKLLKDHVVPYASEDETKTFLGKTQGDYYRYLCEMVEEKEEKDKLIAIARDFYKEGLQAAKNLPTTNQIKLGILLNVSVFYKEILGDQEKACSILKNGFESAIEQLDCLSEEEYKDSTLIMQLMKDNLSLWAGDDEKGDDEDEDHFEDDDEDCKKEESDKASETTIDTVTDGREKIDDGKKVEGKVDEPKEREMGIVIQKFDPKEKYLQDIVAKKGFDAQYKEYLLQKKKLLRSPSFYLDCSNMFFDTAKNEKEKSTALAILFNILELDMDNIQVLRVVAYKLEEYGFLRYAKQIFLKVFCQRPSEVQSKRDLALVLENLSEKKRAAELLYQVLGDKVNLKFDQIEYTCIFELNHLLGSLTEQEKSKMIQELGIEKKFVLDLAVDVRITMAWDTDNTDIDLHVVDPKKEHISYQRTLSTTGGLLSRDFTAGYGPEEFLQRKALSGLYQIKANYFTSHQLNVVGGTTVLVKCFTNYMRKNETFKYLTLRLRKSGSTVLVGSINVK